MSPSQINHPSIERIALVTDFGSGIYLGQMQARLAAMVPGVPVIDLVHDLVPFRPDLAAYLLAAVVRDMPRGTLYLCVVDPGVGGEREGLVVTVDGDWYVGPDNGLLSRLAALATGARAWRIGWRPDAAPATFHGRDWFLPTGARLCRGDLSGIDPLPLGDMLGADWPDGLARVIYVDGFGNLMTGLRAADCPADGLIHVYGLGIGRARTFCDLPPGGAFWYQNALGLVEIAVNQGRADALLGLGPGDPIEPDWPLDGVGRGGHV